MELYEGTIYQTVIRNQHQEMFAKTLCQEIKRLKISFVVRHIYKLLLMKDIKNPINQKEKGKHGQEECLKFYLQLMYVTMNDCTNYIVLMLKYVFFNLKIIFNSNNVLRNKRIMFLTYILQSVFGNLF